MADALKILALIGSPRNEESYTYKVIRQIGQQMNALQPTAIEYVFLGKLLVPYCDGCLSCVRVSEESCPEYATIGPIATKMDEADGLILGAPVHTFAVTGLMKNFVEYFMYKRNRPSFFGKKAIVTCTASGGGHKSVLDFLEGTASAWGCDVVTRLGISSAQIQKARYLALVDESTRDVAEKFVAAIRDGDHQAVSLTQLINFRAMQNMTRSQPGSKNFNYWQARNWLDASYYNDAPASLWSRLMAGYVAGRMRSAIRKGNIRPFR